MIVSLSLLGQLREKTPTAKVAAGEAGGKAEVQDAGKLYSSKSRCEPR